ncbi:hypothetical protein AB1Y20_006815 [Prymnesium parvum]|uniref:RAB6-interacting golgin n=1 Tax=Prymnesium parvum TaxID=97485 RepID=A0AB34IZX9_PRYPA|mmetsp:Transcript_22041/g.54928  ORF Transcript_22041/g.54928 Transcript_22041/m.54928 type:complete len:164 (+) Transcript_22041:13-504(+)
MSDGGRSADPPQPRGSPGRSAGSRGSPDPGVGCSETQCQGGVPSLHCAETLDDDLYGDLLSTATPQLPSSFSLKKQIKDEIDERMKLEEKLQALQQEFTSRKEDVMELTKRACQILLTARLELQRKDKLIMDLQQRTSQATASTSRDPFPSNSSQRRDYNLKL